MVKSELRNHFLPTKPTPHPKREGSASVLIATHNKGKLGEIMAVLKELPIQFVSLDDIGIKEDVEETGATHQENAELKARFFAQLSGLPTLGEDSGIYVDAFPGELGVKTRRFRNMHMTTDAEWVKFFLKELENVPDGKRGAKFVCHAVLIFNDQPYHFYGECDGTITRQLEAPIQPGIPISSCFQPLGCDKVYAALSPQEKGRISHRGKAIGALRRFLEARLTK